MVTRELRQKDEINEGKGYTERNPHSILASHQCSKFKPTLPEPSTKGHEVQFPNQQVFCKAKSDSLVLCKGGITFVGPAGSIFWFKQSAAGSALLNTI